MAASRTEPTHRSFWGWCRCSFRWCRITVLTLVFLLLAGLTWLRLVGLPDFLRVRIVSELLSRGVTADFTSLHFHWFRGLVATDLRVAWAGPQGPRLSIAEADIDLAPPPWRESRELVRGLRVRRGSLDLPLPLEGEPTTEVRVEKVSADIRFLPGDAWEIRQLEASALGINLRLRANLTNLTALRSRKPTAPPDPAAATQRLRMARAVVEELGRWASDTPPNAEISLVLDGREPEAAHGQAYLAVPAVRTPRGDLSNLRLSLRVPPPAREPEAPAQSSLTAEVDGVQTGEGGFEHVSARLDLTGPRRPGLPTNAVWQVSADHVFLRGFRVRDLTISATNDLLQAPVGLARTDLEDLPVATRLTAKARTLEAGGLRTDPILAAAPTLRVHARHPLVEPLRSSTPSRPATVASVAVRADSVTGPPGSTGPVSLDANLRLRTGPIEPAPEGVAWWASLWPFSGSISAHLSGVRSPQLAIESLDLDTDWLPPALALRRLEARLGGGAARLEGGLDVATRRARVRADTDFDLHVVDGLLTPKALENFERYQWSSPPWVKAEATATLPPWNAEDPDWKGTVQPTVQVNASLKVGPGSFKGVPFDSAESPLLFDGHRLTLPALTTTRPEGTQHLVVDYDTETREYRVDGRGPIRPHVLKPLIGEKSAEVMDLFEFLDPVNATVSVWGPWTEGTSQSIAGSVVATNFLFRGHRLDRLETAVVYTNRTLVASPARLWRDQGTLVVERARYEFDADLLTLTNAVNTIDPAVVTGAISPDFPDKLRHYRFDTHPSVRVDGTIQPRQPGTADLAFEIEGGPFHFWRFSAPHIQTRMLWKGQNLVFTNIQASFYRGVLTGEAVFDLSDPEDGRYQFGARVRDSELSDLLHEATLGRTNVAQGSFDLDLNIHSARTSDLWTWNGSGHADLRDGLLWDTPIFGFLSPVLNAAVPGLGNSRARRAEASFVVSNGVFHTRDLTIACPPANLLYRGTIDLDQRVQAKVEAEAFGGVAGFGPLFGLVLRPLSKLLEFRVTGTLSKFEAEPVYVPKFLLLPLKPFKVIKDMLIPEASPGGNPTASTNAPPATPLQNPSKPGDSPPPATPQPGPTRQPLVDPPAP